MGYDPQFFEMYERYLNEPTVRRNHDMALGAFDDRFFCLGEDREYDPPCVVDLGCGIGEFATYGHWCNYVGVDREDHGLGEAWVAGDYTDPSVIARLPFTPNAFVSLFSIEACYSAAERYALYERIFREYDHIRLALAAGFYYESKMDLEKVLEAGGIVSYQTLEPFEFHRSDVFDETRILMRTPSEMFGRDVVEVWKILQRR